MTPYNPMLLRKRQTSSSLDVPFSGSVVVSNPTPTASLLVQNTAAVGGSSETGVPLISTDSSSSAPSTSASDASASSTSSSTTSPINQISMGTVIGACIGAFVSLLLAISLAIYCSRRQKQIQKRCLSSRARNAENNSSRRRSHLEAWGRLQDAEEDRWEGKSSSMKQRPPSGSGPKEWLAAMFSRAPSTPSVEKSSESHAPAMRESFGTLEPFEKYHPHLAAEMASQTGSQVAMPPPVRPFMGRIDIGPSVSWDGETLGAESFLSRRSLLSGTMSPTLMSKEKPTPPATASDPHRWERAEVLHTDHTPSIASVQDPFADTTGAPLQRVASNPFFNAQEKLSKRPPLPTTNANPFADSASVTVPDTDSTDDLLPPRNPQALASLIAALDTTPAQAEERLRIASMQSSVYSSSSYIASENGEDAVTAAAFPYPPPHS
ncbi:hypothetical protein V8B97DRAFT_1957013 [Scleroderma yunnanense]